MTKLNNNPSAPITEDGEYELFSGYKPGDNIRVELTGNRGGGAVQIGLVDVDGNFAPLLPPVTDEADPSCWEVGLGATGRAAVKVSDAVAPSLKATSTRLTK